MKHILLLFISLTAQHTFAQSFPDAADLSTGQGAINTNDPIWQTSQWFTTLPPLPTDPSMVYTSALIQNSCTSVWIDPATLPPPVNNGNWITGANSACTGIPGYTYFRLTLNLPAACGTNSVTVAGNYVLNFDGYVDNEIEAVYINGNDEGVTPGGNYAAGGQKNIILDGPWVAGINYVDILVYNSLPGGGGPYGLLLVANTTAPSATNDDDADGIVNLNDNCPCTAGNNNAGCTAAPNNCNTALIRTTLVAAGNIELLNNDNSCSIYFLNTTPNTEPAAQAYAQTFGANLISVQSAAENSAIRNSLVNQNYGGNVIWLGFSDAVTEGSFVWYDGSSVTYTNWSPSQPDNSGNEDCTQIRTNGTWNDLPCSRNSISVIEVSLCPQVTITTNKPTHCVGANVMLVASTILGSPNYTYTWTQIGNSTIAFIDKTGNNDTILIKSNVANTFTATSTDRYGCQGVNVITVNPNSLPTTTLTPTNIDCFGAANGAITTVVATGTAPYTYAWSNAAITANITALSPATYTLTVTDANGCVSAANSSTITQPATALSVSNVVVNNVKCFGGNDGDATLVATGGTPPYVHAWNTVPPQVNVTATNLTQGTYTYTVLDDNNCRVTGTTTITEPTQLTVAITGNKANCANDATATLTTLTATATNGTGPMYSYSWTPNTSTTNTIVCNSVVGATVYTVVAKDQNNCTATANVTHDVNANPTVAYTVDSVCIGTPSQFKSIITTVPKTDIVTYAWLFSGPGVPPNTTSSAENPTYPFTDCNKNYTASLVAISNKNCVGVSNNATPATVYCLPVPNFTVNDGCEKNDTINFTNTSANGTGTTGAITNAWLLDAATGVIATVANPTKIYAAAGNYVINLGVADVNGCVNATSKNIKIYPKPTADFTLTKTCFGKPTLMSNTSNLATIAGFNDVINDYKWDYNYSNNSFTIDATTSGASTIYPITATETMPTIALIVTTNNNCADTITKQAIVWPLPVTNYTVSAPCFPANAVLTNNSSISNGTDNSIIATMNLTWGDASTDVLTTPNQVKPHAYTVSNAYVTELTVTSNHNCSTKLQVPTIVHPTPKALFGVAPTQGCSPLCVNLTNNSTQTNLPANEPITSYVWNLGDYSVIKLSDNTSNSKHTSHCYENLNDTTQHYTVRLIVSTDYGCADTLTQTNVVEVYPNSKAQFEVAPKEVDLFNPQLIITDASHLAATMQWVYKSGDTVTVTNDTPMFPIRPFAYSYKDSGMYTVVQITTSADGCVDSATQQVRVKPIYTLYIPNVFTPNEDKINDYFMIKGVGIKALTLTIFDRWGEVVGIVQDPASKGWDGNDYKTGVACKTEIYNWRLNYTDLFNVTHESMAGSVTLIK